MRLNWGTAPVGPFEIFEVLLVLVCLVLAFTRPAAGAVWFVRVEGTLKRLSERPWLCAVLLFAFPLAVRLILLPVYGPPTPLISDEYAYLLQADTFSAGRWTNPPPPQPEQFASVYVLTQPTYTAEYQPAQGLSLAAGQILTGRPWVGVLLSMGVLCALVYWALLAWLPPVWALAGAALVLDVEIGVLSYWMNSYWGGCIPAIGGTLAVGGLARLSKNARVFHALVTAAGLVVLMNSRPLEGLFLTLVAAGALVYWTFIAHQITSIQFFSRIVPALAASAVVAIAFAAYYNGRVTEKPAEFPYLLYRAEYGMPQGFFWQKPVTVDTAAMPTDIRAEYQDQLRQHERRTSLKALVAATGGKLRRFWEFYIGIPLTLALVFLPFIWREPNMRLALWTLAVILLADNLLFFAYFPHYSAAVIAPIVLVIVQCLRRMRRSSSAGLLLSRSLPVVCVLGLFVPVCGRLIEGALPGRLSVAKKLWQSEFLHDVSREHFVPQLEQEPGPQLVFVHYRPNGQKKFEWIYNGANLATQKIIWARDGGATIDEKLLARFPGRRVWLAEPDATPPRLSPYSQTHSPLSQ